MWRYVSLLTERHILAALSRLIGGAQAEPFNRDGLQPPAIGGAACGRAYRRVSGAAGIRRPLNTLVKCFPRKFINNGAS